MKRNMTWVGLCGVLAIVGPACDEGESDPLDEAWDEEDSDEGEWDEESDDEDDIEMRAFSVANGIPMFNGLINIGNGVINIGNGVINIGNGVINIGNGVVRINAGMNAQTNLTLDTDEKRKFYGYLVQCALPPETSLWVQGTQYTGLLGLAPTWAYGACDQTCQEWVSACMMARVNSNGSSVKLSFRADHSRIGLNADSTYPTPEAGYYGNVFLNPPEMYYCMLGGASQSAAAGRTCANRTSGCGFVFTDMCSNNATERASCTMNNNVPTNCKEVQKQPNGTWGTTRFRTIGVWLK